MNKDKTLIPIDIYKDPLKKNEEGFGFLGCMMQTKEEDKLQCHICGELHAYLATHIRKHGIKARNYRKKFGLCWNTKLLSRTASMKRLNGYLKYSKETRDGWRKKGQEAMKKVNLLKAGEFGARRFSKASLEYKNKTASCPDQILEEISNYANEIGRTPTIKDFLLSHPKKSRYVHLAKKTFGTWENTMKKLGLEPNKSGDKIGNKHKVWDRETLIEMLQLFTRENNRLPRSIDCYSGELPTRSVFQKMFGGLEKARQEARVEDLIIN